MSFLFLRVYIQRRAEAVLDQSQAAVRKVVNNIQKREDLKCLIFRNCGNFWEFLFTLVA